MMYGNNLVFWWCCTLLFVASSSKHQRNFTNNNEKHENSTVQNEFDENSMNNYDDEMKKLNWITNFTKNVLDNIQFDHDTLSMENYNDKDTSDFTSYEHNKTDFNDDGNVNVPFSMCIGRDFQICYPICCQLDDQLTDKCTPGEIQVFNAFTSLDLLKSNNQDMNLIVYMLIYDPCNEINQFHMYKYRDISNDLFITSGIDHSRYFPYYKKNVKPKSFCLINECLGVRYMAIFKEFILSKQDLNIYIYETDSPDNPLRSIIYHKMIIRLSLRILSILFLLATFLVYSIIPELRNKHGFILCNCIGVMIVAYIFESANNVINYTQMGYSNHVQVGNSNYKQLDYSEYIQLGYDNYVYLEYFIYVIIAFVCYFCFSAAYFWLSVMSFDIWWTMNIYIIKDISSLQGNVRNYQQERERKKKDRKKLIMYSVYVWGSSFILTTVCFNKKFIDCEFPTVPDLARPEFGIIIWHYYYWFEENATAGLYYYWIHATICSISSICLFVSTALQIRRYEKDTTHHLRNVDSWVYDEHKKWFNLCQKWLIMMFIVIGISAFIGIVWFIFPYTLNVWHILYIAHSTDMAQNIGIFITFVCNKRIKELFGCQNYNVPPTARETELTEVDTVSNRNSLLDETIAFNSAMHVKEFYCRSKISR